MRQQAADLIQRIALCARNCGEEARLSKLGIMLYECLGEEYPEVLGSILGGLKAIVNVIGMSKMTPPVKDLLPRLTPILKKPSRKSAGECDRPCRAYRRQRSRVRLPQGVDAYLFRFIGPPQGSQERDQESHREHLRIYREGDWSAGRARHAAEQP